MTVLSLDFELCSRVNLKTLGLYRWLEDESTQILCLGYKMGDTRGVWVPGGALPPGVDAALRNPLVEKRAWNAAFERTVFKYLGSRYQLPAIADKSWRCTMVEAAAAGLPLALEKAAVALKLPIQKDMEGHALMLRMARPRTDNAYGVTWWHENDRAKYKRLQEYCLTDVDTEAAIAEAISGFNFLEHELWLVDQRMNEYGLLVDARFNERMIRLSQIKAAALDDEMEALTGGEVTRTTQLSRLHAWATKQGCLPLGSLSAGRLAELITHPSVPPLVRRALRLRQQSAKTSVAKLYQMAWGACKDGRLRGLVQFHGAIRTGRWAGRQAQIQNYPSRGLIDDIDGAIHYISKAPAATTQLCEALELTWGDTMLVVSSCLRGCFVPSPGHLLIVMDYSQIEARVLAWLAGDNDLLDVFARGEDVYVFAAKRTGSDDRLLGKIKTLGLGYGMGPAKFVGLCESYGIDMPAEKAETEVYEWREANSLIPTLWNNMEKLVQSALGKPGTPFELGKVAARFDKKTGILKIRLPSGRLLIYREFRLTSEGYMYAGVSQTSTHWRSDIRTWGGKLVENVTQAVARDLLGIAMSRIDAMGIPLIGTVHDEVIAETSVKTADCNLKKVREAMVLRPRWVDEKLPLSAAGQLLTRYGKH